MTQNGSFRIIRKVNKTSITVVFGDVITPTEKGQTLAIPNGGIAFDNNGTLVSIAEEKSLQKEFPSADVLDARGHLILPGLIDTHSHISQYPISASSDIPMGEWMRKFVYPSELEFSRDHAYARKVCRAFFQEALSLGTTSVATFAVTSTEATECVFEEAKRAKIRAFIGKVLMDQNADPELLENAQDALKGLEHLKKKWHQPGTLEATVNPRFSAACSEELLKAAGRFAETHSLLLQTHLDYLPSFWPFIKKHFPWAKHAVHLFQEMGCFVKRAVFAHGTGLNKEEYDLLGKCKASISHCPNSNLYCGMGLLPVKALMQKNVLIGLGTDSGGGPTLSLFDVMRSAGEISKIIASHTESTDWLSVYELLRMATYNGAKMLGIDDLTGSLEKGKQADFIIVEDQSTDPLLSVGMQVPYQSLSERLSRVIYRAHPTLVTQTFVKGINVFKRH